MQKIEKWILKIVDAEYFGYYRDLVKYSQNDDSDPKINISTKIRNKKVDFWWYTGVHFAKIHIFSGDAGGKWYVILLTSDRVHTTHFG